MTHSNVPQPEPDLHDLFTMIGHEVELDQDFEADLRQKLEQQITMRRHPQKDEPIMLSKTTPRVLRSVSLSFVGVLAVVLVGMVLWTTRFSENLSPGARPPAVYESPYADISQRIEDADGMGLSFGNSDAPLTLTAYVDFNCSYSRSITHKISGLIDDYVRDGTVRIVIKPLTLVAPQDSKPAAAAYCAALQGKGWEMNEELWMLFDQGGGPEAYTYENLFDLAGKLGLNRVEFEYCVVADETQDILQNLEEEALAQGVVGVPTIYLNDEVIRGDSVSADELKATIDGMLAELEADTP